MMIWSTKKIEIRLVYCGIRKNSLLDTRHPWYKPFTWRSLEAIVAMSSLLWWRVLLHLCYRSLFSQLSLRIMCQNPKQWFPKPATNPAARPSTSIYHNIPGFCDWQVRKRRKLCRSQVTNILLAVDWKISAKFRLVGEVGEGGTLCLPCSGFPRFRRSHF